MRKITAVTILVAAAVGAGIYVYIAQPFNPTRAEIEELSTRFMEDIQFKDFDSSARYHHELERDRVDIGRAIEELFLVDPELIDILDYRIVRSELDSTGTRGRVLVSTRFRPLEPEAVSDDEEGDDIEEVELQLFWMKRHPECPLGSDCEDGVCRDEDDGETVMKETEDGEETESEESSEEEESEEPFECDATLDHEWFMNLDSTLEARDYE